MPIKFNPPNYAQPIVVQGTGQSTREWYQFFTNLFNAGGAGSTLGSAAFKDIGVNGAAVPLLNTINEWAVSQTFDQALDIKGATSGTTVLRAAANAGGVVTLPTITTTLVGQNTTDTLSNKTLQNPTITGTASGANTIPLTMLTPAVAVGQFPATATNDSATNGYIGEYKSATVTSGAAVTVTSNTSVDVTSISLTAGNWLVTGSVAFAITGTGVQNIQAWTNTSSAALPAAPSSGGRIVLVVGGAGNFGDGTMLPAGLRRVTLTTTTNIYLTSFAIFGSGSVSAYGFIEAWRPR